MVRLATLCVKRWCCAAIFTTTDKLAPPRLSCHDALLDDPSAARVATLVSVAVPSCAATESAAVASFCPGFVPVVGIPLVETAEVGLVRPRPRRLDPVSAARWSIGPSRETHQASNSLLTRQIDADHAVAPIGQLVAHSGRCQLVVTQARRDELPMRQQEHDACRTTR